MATILVVDDLAANRDVLVALLSHLGHRLVEASNGSEGLAAVHAEHPNLVITDVLMPVMDGYELVRQLRLDPKTSAIPVLFYTAHYGEREARALAFSSGVAHVLTKPVDPEEVLKIVGRVLSGESGQRAPSERAPLEPEFDREHLRLLTDKLSEKAEDLQIANAKLRALVNIGLELASERDSARMLQSVSTTARDLFGATYVTIGILDRHDRTLRHLFHSGVDSGSWITTGDSVSGLLQTVVTERRPLRGDNPSGDPSRLLLPGRHPDVRAYLAAPLASPAHVYGWICLVGNEGQVFSQLDESLVTALSGQVGRIYENGYFHSVAEKRAAELEREVVERRGIEAALRQERDRAQRFLDTTHVILLGLDTSGRITLVNRYACDLLGWTAAELIGRDWVETCVPPRERDSRRRRLESLLQGDVAVAESAILTKAGTERVIEWNNTLQRDEADKVIGTFSSGTDVTERQSAIEALREAEERTRFALQSAKVGIWDMDYTNGKLRWSETLEAQYGLSPGTFDGSFETFTGLIHPDDRETTLQGIGDAITTGEAFETHHRALWPDGTVRWLQGAGRAVLDKDGQPARAVGISIDVTERRTLEEQFHHAQKMEAVGRLAGGIAHDFNNLLTAILGYSEMLMLDLDSGDPRRADIAEIHKAGSSAASLTRQLLAFSRKELIEPKLLDLNVVVSGTRSMLGRIIGEDVTIVLEPSADPLTLLADQGQLEQVIVNLAVNARDAMPHGGVLTIATSGADLDQTYAQTHPSVKPGRYVRLRVTDTGTGMTEPVKAHLFEPFFTTKRSGTGTGLGLATVHGIVARSGGAIDVETDVGHGTSFTLYFPAANGDEIRAEPAPAPSRPHSPTQTILVVDDSEGLQQLTRRLLTRMGYTVLSAGSAAEALQLFESNPAIELVLTDVVMPEFSGPELVALLVSRRPGLKVVYMSGYTDEAIVDHGVVDSSIAFLHKPFTSEALAQKVREQLDR